jgi:hypothetical protein
MDILKDLYVEDKSKVVVKNLLTKTSFSITEIAVLADVSEDFVKKVKKGLKSKAK